MLRLLSYILYNPILFICQACCLKLAAFGSWSMKKGPSGHLLRWSWWFVNHGHAWLSLDPDFGSAAQRFVWAVNNFAGTIDSHLMAVVIWFVCLHRNDRFVVSVGCITSYDVLVYVYVFFHLYLSVCALVRVSRRLMASYRTLSGLI